MSRHLGSARRLLVWSVIGLLAGAGLEARSQGSSRPQPASTRPVTSSDDPLAAAEEREARALQRYLALLEKTPPPRHGAGPRPRLHVERGSLDLFLKSLRDRMTKAPDDGASWLILGLLEAQRGRDAAAVEVLGKAEAARPGDPLPAYYLGQELVLVGQPERAPRRSSGPSAAGRSVTTCWRSSRRWAACTSAPRSPTRPSRSRIALRPSSRTTSGCRSRSPRPWPRRTSPPRPCPDSRP
ncbi:MAG: hypothetical protein ABSH35_33330 [Isosphaeraceae bacterium]